MLVCPSQHGTPLVQQAQATTPQGAEGPRLVSKHTEGAGVLGVPNSKLGVCDVWVWKGLGEGGHWVLAEDARSPKTVCSE